MHRGLIRYGGETITPSVSCRSYPEKLNITCSINGSAVLKLTIPTKRTTTINLFEVSLSTLRYGFRS